MVSYTDFNPTGLRTAKNLWSFGCSECYRIKRSMDMINYTAIESMSEVLLTSV